MPGETLTGNAGFVESLAETLRWSGGYAQVINASPARALELVKDQFIEVTTLCMDGACATQREIRDILLSRGAKLAFIPESHDVPLVTFQRFLAAAGC